HRSGRTGRAGKFGTSIVIANLKEKGKLKTIEKMIGKKFAHLPIPLGKEICERQLFHLIDRMEKVEVDDSQIDSFLPEINLKLEWMDRDELIKKFVSLEFNRFLDYYRNAPDLNKPSAEKGRSSTRGGSDGFTRFFLNLGKLDGLKPADVIGMINDYTGTKNLEIGEIDIRKTYSFFEVDKAYTKEILSAFKNKRLKKREINVEVTTKEPRSNQSNRRGRKRSANSSKPWMNQGRKSGQSKRKNKKTR
ncbi:DEAD-box ATP-dependent RNA helicase DeaD (= CshA), partial [hydrothermal vent metagenome]